MNNKLLLAIRFLIVHGTVEMEKFISFVAQLSSDKNFLPEATVRAWIAEGKIIQAEDKETGKTGVALPVTIAGLPLEDITDSGLVFQLRLRGPLKVEEIVKIASCPVSAKKLYDAFRWQSDWMSTMHTAMYYATRDDSKIRFCNVDSDGSGFVQCEHTD